MPHIATIPIPQEHRKRHRDPLHLFAWHVEWRSNRNLDAYQELVAALDDHDEQIRDLAEELLHRCSPRPQDKQVAKIRR